MSEFAAMAHAPSRLGAETFIRYIVEDCISEKRPKPPVVSLNNDELASNQSLGASQLRCSASQQQMLKSATE